MARRLLKQNRMHTEYIMQIYQEAALNEKDQTEMKQKEKNKSSFLKEKPS